jgi:hypothetical protein
MIWSGEPEIAPAYVQSLHIGADAGVALLLGNFVAPLASLSDIECESTPL